MKNILIVTEDNKYNFNLFKNLSYKKYKITNILTKDEKNIDLLKKLNKEVTINKFCYSNFLYENKFPKKNYQKYINFFFKREFFDLLQYYEYEKKFNENQKNFLLKKTVSAVLSYIEKNNFDIIFFSHIPHDFLEFTLIYICKKKNIKVIFTRGFPIPNYYFFTKKIYDVSLIRNKVKAKKTKLYSDIKNNVSNFNIYLKKKTLWQNHELIKIHEKLIFFNFAEIIFFIRLLSKFIFRFILLSSKFLLVYIINKQKFISLFYHSEIDNISINKKYFLENINKLKMEKIYYFNDLKKNVLIKTYLKMTKKISLNDKFVYFPLWFQPSSTTYPYAGRFKHYLNSIKIISKSLPKNINLYVRESPDIFNISRHAWTRGPNSRSAEFYNEINNIKNVRLIDYKIEDKKLVQKCLFSISTSDKLGVMSLYYNKSIINFGDSVYKYFRNCFQYKNLTKLKRDVRLILKNINKKNFFFKQDLNSIANNFFYRPKILAKDNFKIAKKINYSAISKILFNSF